jgi:hypothetical protein
MLDGITQQNRRGVGSAKIEMRVVFPGIPDSPLDLETEASGSPESIASIAASVAVRAPSKSINMSAHLCLIAWNEPIALPN